MKNGTILIVDDNRSVLASLEMLLENEFGTIHTAAHPQSIINTISNSHIDVVVLDMNFSSGFNNGNEGLYWLKRIREIRPSMPVIMLTAYGDIDLAVKALKNGAADFQMKPWNNNTFINKIREAYIQSKGTKHQDTKKAAVSTLEPQMLIGHSKAMLELYKIVTKVSATDADILITGENGTGKEMLAREIHRLSTRNSKQMQYVDMGAVSETLFESELFGHERGSFTGAYDSRPGKFEAADGSTLFMDEIGNLSICLQSKLLSALQSRKITRIGSTKAVPVDIRLISATNRDIPAMVQQGLFREDLFYRINTIHIEIPPLRERGDDILLFIDIFMKRYSAKYGRQDIRMQDQTIDKLRSYSWPGNIRELQHTIEKAVILCENGIIRPKDIMLITPSYINTCTMSQSLDQMEQQAISSAISRTGGNLTAAAADLGISRQTLYNKLKRFNK